ncbi:uncharacterized protein RMCC_0923 [Mycolicibacterium canariasense]|uniref:Uncharacterized protein n=2 Tax=Mycolicibacterium canariasense TaxID=228230 RepID=A0A100W963_MYCCR|nr:uncharacterized protein RMCC_0923 [Mycolicibacterium canariasense]
MTGTRRKLLLWSAPVAVALALFMVKALSVVIVGDSAARDFAAGRPDALRADAAVLGALNIVEPARAHVADGALAVLEDRLDDADAGFAAALVRTTTESSCPVRVDLELVRETLGDRAAGRFDAESAARYYRGALEVVRQAPQRCFAGNADPDADRRAIRDTAATRLEDKLRAVAAVPPPPPPPPAAGAPAPTPVGGAAPTERDPGRQLHPGTGDPLERLQQILQDARG